MLKHCHSNSSSSGVNSRRSLTTPASSASTSSPDSASLNSSGCSVSFNSSFGSSVDPVDQLIPQQLQERRCSFSSPEPISLVSRASSFASLSLFESGGGNSATGPKTPIKVSERPSSSSFVQ